MFSKPQNATPTPPASTPTNGAGGPPLDQHGRPDAKPTTSLFAGDLKLEGNITGGSEVQIDGTITGDVRIERVVIGENGRVEGAVHAEAVEVRGHVSGSITAKQVRLYGAAHVEGDITHEQLAIETGAFFQGRSLRLQRQPAIHAPASQPQALSNTVANRPTPSPPAASEPEPAKIAGAA